MELAYIDPGSGYVVATGLGYIIAVIVAFFGAVLWRLKQIIAFIKGRPRVAALLGLVVLAGALSPFAYHFVKGTSMGQGHTSMQGRVVILGIDGMSPQILEPMMKAGKMPHFAQLAEQGAYRRLATTNPSQSPVAWAGFATGQNPGKHGLYDFIRRDPKTYALSLSTATFENGKPVPVVTAKRFWQYATDAGVESVILGCPITFPPDKIKGRMLSGMGVPDILGTEGTFTFYTSEAPTGKDVGGRVEVVSVQTELTVDLYGPRRQGLTGVEQVTVPMRIINDPEHRTVEIEIQGGDRFTLREGAWSDWQSVTFSLGMFKKMKGILQLYLVETSTKAFKLYVSPINYDPREPAYPITYPYDYAKELAGAVGLFYTQGMPADTWSLNEKRLDEQAFLARVDGNTAQRRKMLDLELGRVKQGIVYAYFDALDVTQHMFWRYRDAKSPLHEEGTPYDGVLDQRYRQMDDLLGHVMTQLDPRDVLLVLSDHGFASFRRAAHVNAWLRARGYLQLTDPAAAEGGELLDGVDWTKTRAYALGFGAVYLNLRGREGQGIVEPGAEARALTARIVEELQAWKDDDGASIVSAVYPREEIFWGPRVEEAPDLFIGFRDGYRASWQTALGATPATLIEDNAKKWSGDHLIDPALVPGILLANRAMREKATMYDLAPTILRAIGCERDRIEEMKFDGEPLW